MSAAKHAHVLCAVPLCRCFGAPACCTVPLCWHSAGELQALQPGAPSMHIHTPALPKLSWQLAWIRFA